MGGRSVDDLMEPLDAALDRMSWESLSRNLPDVAAAVIQVMGSGVPADRVVQHVAERVRSPVMADWLKYAVRHVERVGWGNVSAGD